MNLQFLLRLKTRDAAVLYAYLFESLHSASGETSETSFERLAANMTSAGITTSRGGAFSASVLRSKFAELESFNAVERVATSSGAFRVLVFAPFQTSVPSTVEATVQTTEPRENREQVSENLNRANTLSQNENENGNENEKRVQNFEHNKDNILLINKQKNKARESEKEVNQPQAVCAVEAVESEAVDARPKASDVKKLVNFAAPKVAKFRDALVRRVWEREINPELIDRLAALAVLKIGGVTAAQVFGICSEAKESTQRYERTDGRVGRQHMWQTIGYSCKRIYEAAGWLWTPTKIGVEPKPEPKREVIAV